MGKKKKVEEDDLQKGGKILEWGGRVTGCDKRGKNGFHRIPKEHLSPLPSKNLLFRKKKITR